MSKCKKLQSKRAANVWYRTISNPSCGVPVASATLRTSFISIDMLFSQLVRARGGRAGAGAGSGARAVCVLMRAGAKPVWFQARISCQGVRFGSVVALGQMLADPRRGGVVACGRARLPGVVPREGCGILRCRVHRAWCAHGQMGPEGTQGRWQCCGSDGTTAGTRPASAQADVMRALC